MRIGPKALAGTVIAPAAAITYEPRFWIVVALLAAVAISMIGWHLQRGGTMRLARTPRGHMSLTLRSPSRRRP